MRDLLSKLKELVQEAAAAPTPQGRVETIVTRVKSTMGVDICSLYLAGEDSWLTLVASKGLNPAAVGQVRLRLGEGLVGLIAQTQHPLNVKRASMHPAFRYFPEIGEEGFEGFLGAPVVYAGQLVGVLVVEHQARRQFSHEEESFLITVAAQLGTLRLTDFLPGDALPSDAEGNGATHVHKGVHGAPGIGIGRVVPLFAGMDHTPVQDTAAEAPEAEMQHFREALEAVDADLVKGQQALAQGTSGEVAEVFEIHRMLLRSNEISSEVEAEIVAGNSAAGALRRAVSKYAAIFEAIEDPYLRARGEDIRNLGNRIYAHLCEALPAAIEEGEKVVLVGKLVSISDLAAHPPEQLAGIVSTEGSALSHTALLANALGVPAVMGIQLDADFLSGVSIIVDGYQGQVIVSPSPLVIEEYQRLLNSDQSLLSELAKLKNASAETSDGARVMLLANTGLLADIEPGRAHGAEGIGLYRTEVPFIVRDSFPSEDVQCEIYRTVLEAYQGKPVYMRTLDVGSDKPLPYYPVEEENPALGWRGLRFTLDNAPILMTQLRAMLRASSGPDNLQILLPMVSETGQVEAFRKILDSACAQLAEEGIPCDHPKVGIMAEVPAIISLLPFLASKIDFVSIGSNDLSQYLLAVDRNNFRVTALFDHLHPGVIRAVEEIATQARAHGIAVSLCGEMASDPCAAVLLLGMGIDSLSMSAPSIPRIKWLIRTISQSAAREQLELAKLSADPRATREQLCGFLKEQGLERLLKPGI